MNVLRVVAVAAANDLLRTRHSHRRIPVLFVESWVVENVLDKHGPELRGPYFSMFILLGYYVVLRADQMELPKYN